MSKKKKKPSPQAGGVQKPTQERSKARAQRQKARAAHRKAMRKREEALDASLEQDGTFAFIAGYTSNGVPYGTTWEELGLEPFASQDELLAAYDRYGAGLVDDDFDFDSTDDDPVVPAGLGSDSWEDPDSDPVDREKHEPFLPFVLEDIDDEDIGVLPF